MIAVLTQPNFNQKAKCYDHHAVIQSEVADWLSKWLPTKKTGAALEVGAGTGHFTRYLHNWNGSLVATDSSQEMVEIGAQKIPHISWERQEAHDLQYNDLDWIFSSSTLQWMNDPLSVLKHWADCLKPGGRVLCSVFISGTLGELNQYLSEETIPLTWRDEHDWQLLFEKAGLNILTHQVMTKVVRYDSCLSLLRSLHGIGAVSKNPRLYAGALRKIIKAYDQNHRRGDYSMATYRYMRILAQCD